LISRFNRLRAYIRGERACSRKGGEYEKKMQKIEIGSR